MPRACSGRDGCPCLFNRIFAGFAAQARPGGPQCLFCSLEQLELTLATPYGRGYVRAALRDFASFDVRVYEAALAAIGEVTPDMQMYILPDSVFEAEAEGPAEPVSMTDAHRSFVPPEDLPSMELHSESEEEMAVPMEDNRSRIQRILQENASEDEAEHPSALSTVDGEVEQPLLEADASDGFSEDWSDTASWAEPFQRPENAEDDTGVRTPSPCEAAEAAATPQQEEHEEEEPEEPTSPIVKRRRYNRKMAPRAEDQCPSGPATESTSMKRPAARTRLSHELCNGSVDGQSCRYATQLARLGQAARVHPDRGEKICLFCCPDTMRQRCQLQRGKQSVTQALKFFKTHSDIIYNEAFLKVPAAHRAYFEAALQRSSRRHEDVAARRATASAEDDWAILLPRRTVLQPAPTAIAQEKFRQRVRDDRRRVEAKFPAAVAAVEMADDSWRSPAAASFAQWCRKKSWVMCASCSRMEKRPLRESDLTEPSKAKNTIKKCKYCSDQIGYPTVQLEDIPIELRGLSVDAIWALRPLEPDTGVAVWAKHGYRVHTDMIRLWWRPVSVQTQIDSLSSPEDRGSAKAAYRFLMSSEATSYCRFVEMHQLFLQRHADALAADQNARILQLPRRCIEEVGVECALWPQLYPRTDMCETYIRSQDIRRKARKKGAESYDDSSSSEAEVEGNIGFARRGRNSAKASYLAKVLGPVAEYGAKYELFQFVYDLWLWTTLGAKKNSVQQPLRLAMSGYSFSPEYWRTRHAALIDQVKQLGLPTLFVTLAPYEWSFPMHLWVEAFRDNQINKIIS
jgi:hypothetical protein